MSMKVTKEQFIGMTYDELLAENEKLWALNEHMGLKDMAVIGGLEKENERLKDDNAKLRELARKLIILAFARCADCDLFDVSCALVPTQKCLLWNECESIARELGVEVDDGLR